MYMCVCARARGTRPDLDSFQELIDYLPCTSLLYASVSALYTIHRPLEQEDQSIKRFMITGQDCAPKQPDICSTVNDSEAFCAELYVCHSISYSKSLPRLSQECCQSRAIYVDLYDVALSDGWSLYEAGPTIDKIRPIRVVVVIN